MLGVLFLALEQSFLLLCSTSWTFSIGRNIDFNCQIVIEGINVHAEFVTLLENGVHDTLDHLDSDDYVKVVLEPFDFNLYIHF